MWRGIDGMRSAGVLAHSHHLPGIVAHRLHNATHPGDARRRRLAGGQSRTFAPFVAFREAAWLPINRERACRKKL